jgi:hypothetical protein
MVVMTELKYNINDTVRLLDPEESWARYSELFKELNFINKDCNDSDEHDRDLLKSCTWEVFARKSHTFADGYYDGQTLNVYGIQTEIAGTMFQLLIDEIGLEPLAWPKENAVAQCKRLMKQVTDLITIYELEAEDFL